MVCGHNPETIVGDGSRTDDWAKIMLKVVGRWRKLQEFHLGFKQSHVDGEGCGGPDVDNEGIWEALGCLVEASLKVVICIMIPKRILTVMMLSGWREEGVV